MYRRISSTQNPYIKELLHLIEKAKERRKKELFVIEGLRELSLAVAGDYKLTTILVCKEFIDDLAFDNLLRKIDYDPQIIILSKEVYQKIAYRKTTEGIIAVSMQKKTTLNTLAFKRKNPLILIAESLEKPGNIGALLRTADAASADAVLIADPATDLYNPNVIRSSVGCLFTNQVVVANSGEILAFLKKNNITTYATTLTAAVPYHQVDYAKACAIVVGTEATGLSNLWLENATQNIIIPMQGKIDSMNVSVAMAVVTFEALRQRNFYQ